MCDWHTRKIYSMQTYSLGLYFLISAVLVLVLLLLLLLLSISLFEDLSKGILAKTEDNQTVWNKTFVNNNIFKSCFRVMTPCSLVIGSSIWSTRLPTLGH
jgi:hypothetical protein